MDNQITFSSLQEGMTISFYDEEQNHISVQVNEIYVAEDDANKIIGCAVSTPDGTPYALYEEDGVEIFASKQNLEKVKRPISFSSLQEGMTIFFYDEEQNLIKGKVDELYVSEDNSNRIIGCSATVSDGTQYYIYEESGDEIFSDEKPNSENKIPSQPIKVESKSEPKKILMPTNNDKPVAPKKEVHNLFQGRTESEKGNAKFPDWDIVPPNQFINPRVKQQ